MVIFSECLEQIKKWREGAYIYWPFEGKDFLFLFLLEKYFTCIKPDYKP